MTTNKDTAVERFIQAMIDGGWNAGKEIHWTYYPGGGRYGIAIGDKTDPDEFYTQEELLLCPLAWECAGKSLGWRENSDYNIDMNYGSHRYIGYSKADEWRWKMFVFVDHLANGHDINSALEKIL